MCCCNQGSDHSIPSLKLKDPQWNFKISCNGTVNDDVGEEPCDIIREGRMATASVLLINDSGTKNSVPGKTLSVNVIVEVVVLALIVNVCYIRSARGEIVLEVI